MKVFHALAGGLMLLAGAPSAWALPETYRCLEGVPSASKPSFSMGIAVTEASAPSLGAVTLIQADGHDSEANFQIEALRRNQDLIEIDVRALGAPAEAIGLSTLRIRPSGRAESSALFQNAPVTLSCSRQFL